MKSTTAKKLLAVGAVLAFAAVSTGCDYDADDLFYRHPQHHHHRYPPVVMDSHLHHPRIPPDTHRHHP